MSSKTKKEPQEAGGVEFAIQQIYVKDISYEAPNVPDIFKQEWAPQVTLDVNIDIKKLSDDFHEVALKLTVVTKIKEKTAFLIEVVHAGIFLMKNFDEERLKFMYGSFCPTIIFPYARELISNLTVRGGFPPLVVAPINFEALYQQKLDAEKGERKIH